MTAIQRKERPILFSGPMVRAILEGRKTVTRRVMKPQPTPSPDGGHRWPSAAHQTMLHVENELQNGDEVWDGLVEECCPYGEPGQRLWVRETFAYADKSGTYDAAPDDQWRPIRPGMEPEVYRCWYRASDGHTADGFWKPSIHMPRWASRILLEITDVRVERLQDITYEQAMAEGIDAHPSGFFGNGCVTAAGAFHELWESINGAGSWDANPWVWAISFRRIQP